MINPPLTLKSPFGRIILTTPVAEDDEAVAVLRTEPGIRKHLQFLSATLTVEEVAERRKSRAEDARILDLNVFFQEEGTSKLVGSTGYFNLEVSHRSCEAGIIISTEYQRRNVGTEIFYVLLEYIFEVKKLHRATFETGWENAGMRNWLERTAGIKLEGHRREAWGLPDGSYADVASYAVLEDEWKEVKQRLRCRLESKGITYKDN